MRDSDITRTFIVSFAICLMLMLCVRAGGGETSAPRITFLGGAGEVGGSCHMVETAGSAFLVDCGAFGEAGEKGLPGDGSKISFVLLTHAHSDHCGLIPSLFVRGFRGRVFCTEETAALVPVMLKMARGFSRSSIPREDFDKAVESLVGVEYGMEIEVGDVAFRFRRAGHLLGAAFVEVRIGGEEGNTSIVFSGDLGSGASILQRPLEKCESADYVVMESTYGSVIRKGGTDSPEERYCDFAGDVGRCLRGGNDVLIPAFTLGRTQEVIAVIDLFKERGVIPSSSVVYCDSPTAKRITGIYRDFRSELSDWSRDFYGPDPLDSPGIREVRSGTSLAVHSRKHEPSIFVSSSGNLDYANAPRHLMEMFDDPGNLLCLVGWQAPGSLGDRLSRGASPVLVRFRRNGGFDKEWIDPAIQVKSYTSFSGHADQRGLAGWLAGISGAGKVFLVHGEAEQSSALAGVIEAELGLEVVIPRRRESFVLD